MPAAAADAHAGRRIPSIKRRLICLVYESLLFCGVAFFAGLVFLALSGPAPTGWLRHTFQIYLFLVTGVYFTLSWRRGGQTLAMKTWKLRLVGTGGERVTWRQALLRFACAWPCIGIGAIGILYALIDRDRQFLHGRLAGTRIVIR